MLFFIFNNMIKIDELEILPNGKELKIAMHISDNPSYTDKYLDSISIDNQNTYSIEGDFTKCVYNKSFDENTKHIILIIKQEDLLHNANLDKDLFFIKITPNSGSPKYAAVYNKYKMYDVGMKYLRELNEKCSIPKGFEDYILRLKALELSLKSNNNLQAIKYWNKFTSLEGNKYR